MIPLILALLRATRVLARAFIACAALAGVVAVFVLGYILIDPHNYVPRSIDNPDTEVRFAQGYRQLVVSRRPLALFAWWCDGDTQPEGLIWSRRDGKAQEGSVYTAMAMCGGEAVRVLPLDQACQVRRDCEWMGDGGWMVDD